MTQPSAPRSKIDWLRVLFSVIACAGILAASVGAVVWINRTEPVAQTINAKRKSAAIVETFTVHRGNYRPRISVLGTVEAAREVNLSPRVSGQVEGLSPEFVPGGMVGAGTVLVEMDPADFENALLISNSELEQVQASLDIEAGRQSLAKKELKMLEGTIESTNRSLVLRQPQIASIRAEIKAAEAAVQRAQLDLNRTRLKAPFDAQILTRSVNVGSQVSPGDELGRLVGIEEYWIFAAVPVRSLRWIDFAETDINRDESRDSNDATEANAEENTTKPVGSPATLHDTDAWGPDNHRTGTVSRMIGSLDEQSRLARVLISVADPLGHSSGLPPLILGSLVNVEIEGRRINDVVRLPRDYLRDADTVWVMQKEQLRIVQTDVLFRDAQFVYIRDGLADGDEVITTTLATVADGVRLKRVAMTADDLEPETIEPETIEPETIEPETIEPETNEPEIVEADNAEADGIDVNVPGTVGEETID